MNVLASGKLIMDLICGPTATGPELLPHALASVDTLGDPA